MNKIEKTDNSKLLTVGPDQRGSVGWLLSCRKVTRALAWVAGQVPGWGPARGNWSMFCSHIDIYPPLFLPPYPLSKNKWNLKEKTSDDQKTP